MDVCKASIQHIDDMNGNFMVVVKNTVQTLTTKLIDTIAKLTNENKEVTDMNNTLKEQVQQLEARLKSITRELENSLEEQRQLLKVSRVVAIEKDNARLRSELQQLEAKLQHQQQSFLKSTYSDTTQSAQQSIAPQQQDEQDAFNVREKKIKGVVYYVSDDNDIYTKNDDESIGEVVGKIEGKKVKWL